VLGTRYNHVMISIDCFNSCGLGDGCCGYCSMLVLINNGVAHWQMVLDNIIGKMVVPQWFIIFNSMDTWRNRHKL